MYNIRNLFLPKQNVNLVTRLILKNLYEYMNHNLTNFSNTFVFSFDIFHKQDIFVILSKISLYILHTL
jgi:hypothetical protein